MYALAPWTMSRIAAVCAMSVEKCPEKKQKVLESGRMSVCVCVCVCVRERERRAETKGEEKRLAEQSRQEPTAVVAPKEAWSREKRD